MNVNVVILFVESLGECESFFEELADLFEVFGAEVLLHSHHHWLEELTEVSDSNV